MSVALPGQVLASDKDHVQGVGTHWHEGSICASVLGLVTHQDGVVRVSRAGQQASRTGMQNVLPTVHATVLARVTRLNPRQANVAILVVGEGQDACVCADEFQGLIRVQDIRATEKDKVKIGESFRPGDIVRAVVISLGDQSNYYLETARNHLGVVLATSEAGNSMSPVSWKEFVDPITGHREPRKVAKPF